MLFQRQRHILDLMNQNRQQKQQNLLLPLHQLYYSLPSRTTTMEELLRIIKNNPEVINDVVESWWSPFKKQL